MKDKQTESKIVFYCVLAIFVIITFLSFTSCKSTKTTDTTIIKDSIRESVQLNIIKSGFNSIRFDKPCDEYGNIRPIFYNSSSGGLETTITDDNGSILINQTQKADTIYKEKMVYKDRLIYKDKLIEVEVKRPFNFYMLIYSILATLWILKKPLWRLVKPI